MDGKTVAIGVLVVVAVLLGGLVAGGLRQESVVYGQGGVYSNYLVSPVLVRDEFVAFAVLDTAKRLLIFYDINTTNQTMEVADGKNLTQDFPNKPGH